MTETEHLDAYDGGRAAAAAASAANGDADIRVPGAADPDAVALATSDAAKMAAMFATLGSQPAPAKPEPAAPSAAPVPVATAVATEPQPTPPAKEAAPEPSLSPTEAAARMAALLGGSGSTPIVSTASAADAASFADQAPPLDRKKSSEEPVAAVAAAPPPAPVAVTPPLERRQVEPAVPPPSPATASQPAPRAAAQCRIVESHDGIRTLLDVYLPGGGGAVIVLTPRRSLGDGRSLPPHVGWRGADAVAGDDAKAFARALSDAVDRAAALSPALIE
jgi:hypothetical protein